MDSAGVGRRTWLDPRAFGRVIGEGAFAGLVAGSALAALDLRVHAHIEHRMWFLAALRTTQAFSLGALAGVLLSCAFRSVLPAGSRLLRISGAAAAGLLAVLVGWAVLGPLAPYLVHDSERPFALRESLVLGFVLAATAALYLVRVLDLRLDRPPAARTIRRLVAGTGMATLAIALSGWLAAIAIAPIRARDRPSVILVSIDTLRADRLGVMGSPRPLTPRLDGIAEQGSLFLQAYAPSPWTLPSHASIFTSMMPFDHGGRWAHRPVPPKRSMLAERFRNDGFRTAAFTGGGWVRSELGLGQGFEVFEHHDEIDEGGPEAIFASALRWIREGGDRPFFLFVHTYEPHCPFLHVEFASHGDAGRLGPAFTDRDLHRIYDGTLVLTEVERRYVADLYDGDVAHADRAFGVFLDELDRRGVSKRSILVVLSDHGEELWEHVPTRSPDHGHSLYEELLRVPLIIRAPNATRTGIRIHTPVSLLDVAPTLLELVGLPSDSQHRGRSLASSVRDGAEPEPVPILAESVKYGPDRFAIRSGDLKIISTPYPDRVHLGVRLDVAPLEVYDLSTDPGERENLAGSEGRYDLGPVRSIQARAFARATDAVTESMEGLSEEHLKQLRSLGYVE